jgi:hypothetical protein
MAVSLDFRSILSLLPLAEMRKSGLIAAPHQAATGQLRSLA